MLTIQPTALGNINNGKQRGALGNQSLEWTSADAKGGWGGGGVVRRVLERSEANTVTVLRKKRVMQHQTISILGLGLPHSVSYLKLYRYALAWIQSIYCTTQPLEYGACIVHLHDAFFVRGAVWLWLSRVTTCRGVGSGMPCGSPG